MVMRILMCVVVTGMCLILCAGAARGSEVLKLKPGLKQLFIDEMFFTEHQGIELQWHYGYWDANSSLIVRAPDQGLAFIVLANTSMLSRAYGLGVDSDVLRSDVARLFIESFVTGNEPLPLNH